MNYDEQAVVCESLAELLRAGVTLPDALRQVAGMVSNRKLGSKLTTISDQMARGVPLAKAVNKDELPPMLGEIMAQGAASGRLADTLRHQAENCREFAMLQGRFKQAMAYPLMIFLVAFVGSVVVGAGLWLIGPTFSQMFDVIFDGGQLPWVTRVVLGPRWLVAPAPALLLVPGIILLLLVVMVRRFRSWARWKWPVLREISLWHFASSMALLMEQGMRFEEAVVTMEKCERGSAMGRELSRWRTALANGQTNFVGIAFPSDLVPVFFMGLVNAGGGDLAAGFRVAQHVYRELAYCKLDRVLHLLTPVLVLIGFLYVLVPIVAVVWGLFLPLVQLMTCIC